MIDENIGYAVGDDGTILKYSPTTSIPLVFNSNIHLYPNPSSGEFQVKWIADANEKCNVEIFNTYGQKIYSSGNGEKIDLRNEKSGIYFVEVNMNGRILKGKVITVE